MVDWLGEHYNEYVSTVSVPNMACSLQMARRLVQIVHERKPKRILDMGSGFTSYILRHAAPDADVWSVDTSAEWLQKTVSYLMQNGERAGSADVWEHFISADRGLFDLVVHDMGWAVTRMRTMGKAIDYVRPGGLLVLDDVNWDILDSECTEYAEWYGMTYSKLDDEADEFGRVTGLLEKPAGWVKPSENAVRVIIGAPPAIMVYPETRYWMMTFAAQGFPFIQMKTMPIMIARNKMAEHILAHPVYTHLMMLDMDHEHPPHAVKKLIQNVLRDPSRKVVGGVYVRRGEPYDPMAYRKNAQGQTESVLHPEAEVIPVDALATGCMLVAREVFETIPEPWFEYNTSGACNGTYPSEDIDFCTKCREHGIGIYADYSVHSPHFDIVGRTSKDTQRYIEEHAGEKDASGVLKVLI